MTDRQNYLSLVKRQGYEFMPIHFELCPAIEEKYKMKVQTDKSYPEYYNFSTYRINDMILKNKDTDKFRSWYDFDLKPGTFINEWGVAHEPGSKESMHTTLMKHPLMKIDSMDQLMEYPFPDFETADASKQKSSVELVISQDKIAVGHMACTIWETAWYMRSMEELMMDMISDDPKAEFILDKVTQASIIRAQSYARAGVDVIHMGDDIGMQKSTMMSEDFYCEWLKPRLKKVIDAARKIKPDVLIFYHSCGYIMPFIPHLIDVGVDILNPIQPESMDFEEIHKNFGDKLSFCGTLGTQTTMPFGTPEDVKNEVYKHLKIAGSKGGLLVEPTHIVEPEVPWENIEAYVDACKNFKLVY